MKTNIYANTENDTNSTYCEKCGCRITAGQCEHGVKPPQKIKTSYDIKIRYRMFQVHYVPPGNVRGSRVKIKDLRHNKTIFLPYEGRTDDQAIKHLESIGISCDAIGLADKDSDCVLLSLDKATPLRK